MQIRYKEPQLNIINSFKKIYHCLQYYLNIEGDLFGSDDYDFSHKLMLDVSDFIRLVCIKEQLCLEVNQFTIHENAIEVSWILGEKRRLYILDFYRHNIGNFRNVCNFLQEFEFTTRIQIFSFTLLSDKFELMKK